MIFMVSNENAGIPQAKQCIGTVTSTQTSLASTLLAESEMSILTFLLKQFSIELVHQAKERVRGLTSIFNHAK